MKYYEIVLKMIDSRINYHLWFPMSFRRL